jgi:broad specificity phosphatase PhoE
MTNDSKQLVLMRHGETVGESSIRLYGATDVELAPVGEAQMIASSRSMIGWRFDAVFSSPLRRARRSTEVVLASIEHSPIEIEEVAGFREIDFGAWEGWTWAEIRERDPENLARWGSEGGSFQFPGGDVRGEFVERVQLAIGPTIEARFAAGARSILVVAHKGVVKAIAARLLGQPALELEGFDLELGELRRLHCPSGTWKVESS